MPTRTGRQRIAMNRYTRLDADLHYFDKGSPSPCRRARRTEQPGDRAAAWPFFAALAFHDLSMGAPAPASPLELAMAVLWISAVVFGAGSILWPSLLGMARRRMLYRW